MNTRDPNTAGSAQTVASPLSGDVSSGPDFRRKVKGLGLEDVSEDALIMMVDDEPTTIDTLQVFLEEAGYCNFLTTTDSRDAIGLIASRHPDVVLLDLNMPHVGGFDILRRMRADPSMRHVPVIMLTSSTDADTKLTALELGATDFLGKPVDASELALRLRNTLAAKAYQDRLALYDRLTGLPNRQLFGDHLDRVLWRTRSKGRMCAVMRIDINRFRQVNDSLGHAAGDALLKAVAQRIDAASQTGTMEDTLQLREMPVLARTGGDEFALVMGDLRSEAEARETAKAISNALVPAVALGTREIHINTRIGIAMYPTDGESADLLLRHANAATVHAKQLGSNAYQFYAEDLNSQDENRLILENDLFAALKNQELEVYYQPKVSIPSGRIKGFEALLRWHHPVQGTISPAVFIPIAEESGQIVPIGTWVLTQACRQASEWAKAGYGELEMAVNVSPAQLRDAQLVDVIRKALAVSGLRSDLLTLELTESMLMENVSESMRTLNTLRDLGVKISIDDFGTGYSSLSYLRRLAIDELKVDQSFVRDIPDNPDAAAIVAAVVGMAQGLGLSVVAEGVEREEQRAYLARLGTETFQGYLVSRPVPAPQCIALIDGDDVSASQLQPMPSSRIA